MSTAHLAEQAIRNRPEHANLENDTYMYGGEAVGRPVEALDLKEEYRIRELVTTFGAHVERKFQNDPESLTKAEVVLLDLRNKPQEQAYSPREMAGLYLSLRYMSGQIEDPESTISQERKYHTDPDREVQREAMLNDIEKLRESMFFKLTGLDKGRPELKLPTKKEQTGFINTLKLIDGALREASARDPDKWYRRLAWARKLTKQGDSLMNRFITSRGGEETKSAETLDAEHATEIATVEAERRKFFESHTDFLTLEQDIQAHTKGAWKKVIDELKAQGQLSTNEANDILNAADPEAELRRKITGRGSGAKRNAIIRQVGREAIAPAMEKRYTKELDALAAQAAERELPIDQVEFEDNLIEIEEAIRAKQIQLDDEQSKRNPNRQVKNRLQREIDALEKRRKAAEAALNLADPTMEKKLREPKNRSLQAISRLMPGIPEADIEAELASALDITGPPAGRKAGIERALKNKNSISIWALIVQMLFGMSKK